MNEVTPNTPQSLKAAPKVLETWSVIKDKFPSRQVSRSYLYRECFMEVTKRFDMPRANRRAVARAVAKTNWMKRNEPDHI